jgi:eukaryotic-like serine/threonine-protein kinase
MTAVKQPSNGQIITFYSYKGGTGRTMALANIACLLAHSWVKNEKVLMIDWDLEAPGLHQFFHGRFINSKGELPGEQLGLIDLFYEMKVRLENSVSEDVHDTFFDELNLEKYMSELNIPSLMLMPAGGFGDGLYSTRVNAFDWENFFNNYPLIISRFAEYLRKKYKFVLIDSRTGYTDISGICTSLMPEKLVVLFTLNRQGLTGIVKLIRNAIDYRKQSDDLRPLIVFPLPSKVELGEKQLQDVWRFGSFDQNIEGYQPQLESVLTEVYNLFQSDLNTYFNEVQLQYVPRYSYGEEIAVLSEPGAGRLSLSQSFNVFTKRLIDIGSPW